MRHWTEEIGKASELDQLGAVLRDAGRLHAPLSADALDPECRVDREALPRFGGPEPPRGTVPIWSWDKDRILVGDTLADVRIVSREEWTEWMRKQLE